MKNRKQAKCLIEGVVTGILCIGLTLALVYGVISFFISPGCACHDPPVPEAYFVFEETENSKIEITHQGDDPVKSSNIMIRIYDDTKKEYENKMSSEKIRKNKTWAARKGIEPSLGVMEGDKLVIDKPKPGSVIEILYFVPKNKVESEEKKRVYILRDHKVRDLSSEKENRN